MGNWAKQNSAQFKKMGLAITAMGAVAIVTFTKMVKKYVEVGDMIDKMSKRTGFAAETLSELAFAAEISGADITALEKGVKKMSKTVVDASYGLETYLRVFRSLGLSVEELMELSPEEQFFKIGNAIAEMENVTLRTAAAVDVFGRAGTMLLPLFAEGAEGIKKLREEAQRLGIVFDEEAAAKAAKLKDAQTALKGAFQGLSFAIVSDLIPVLTTLTQEFTDTAVGMKSATKDMALGILEFFKAIAWGIKSLLVAWQGLQAAIFKIAEFIANALIEDVAKLTALLILAEKIPLIGKKFKPVTESLISVLKILAFVKEGYKDLADDSINSTTDIIIAYDKWIARLNKINTALTTTKDKTKELSETLINTLLPAGMNTEGVLDAATEAAKNFGDGVIEKKDKAIEATEAEMAAFRELSWFWQDTLDTMIDTFGSWVTEGGSLMGHFGNLIKTMAMGLLGTMKSILTQSMAIAAQEIIMEQAKALAGIISSVIEAIPFPLNIALIGTAIALINKFFAKLPSFATGGKIGEEGGIVGERGTELFVPDRPGTIIPHRDLVRGSIGATITIAPVFHISAMDTLGVRDFMRNRGLPEIVEAVRVGIKKHELQEVLGV